MEMTRKRLSPPDLVIHAILALFALLTIFPFYYVVIISFADQQALYRIPVYILPFSVDLTSYRVLFSDVSVLRGLLVSLFVTVTGTLLNMVLTITAAYSLSYRELPLRKLWMGLILFTMFFGGQLIPYYLTIKSLGLVNNLLVMVLPAAINTFYLIIIKNYFQGIPDSLGESARIDGAGDLTILLRIILPISMPILATFILFYAVERWNEWWLAMIFISKPRLKPLQIVLREVVSSMSTLSGSIGKTIAQQEKGITIQSFRMAMVVLTTIPILCVYPFLQKYFTTGIMIGSIKG